MDVKRRPLLRPAGVLVPLCLVAALVHCSSHTTATGPGGTGPNPPPAGTPAKLRFESMPHSVGMGDTLPPVRVDVLDSAGRVVSGATNWVTVALGTTRPAAMRGTLAAPAANGVAVFATLSIDSPGVYALRAVATGLGSATSDTFLVRPAPGAGPERLAFEAVPASVTAGDTMPAIRVDILDTAGHLNTAASVQVNIQIDDNPGHGALHGTTSVNAVRGVATFTRLLIDSVGNGYSLRAIGDGMTGAVSDRFNVTAAPPPPPPGTHTAWSWTPLAVATSQRFAALSVDLRRTMVLGSDAQSGRRRRRLHRVTDGAARHTGVHSPERRRRQHVRPRERRIHLVLGRERRRPAGPGLLQCVRSSGTSMSRMAPRDG